CTSSMTSSGTSSHLPKPPSNDARHAKERPHDTSTARPPRPHIEPSEDATRREFIHGIGAAALAAAFLAACGDDDPEATSETWTYESEFGPVELPRTIERVVSIDYYTPAALIDLGVVPVGVVSSYFGDADADYIPSRYRETVAQSGARSVDDASWATAIEAVAAAEPDVIIATSGYLPPDSPIREQLERIAPVVTFP